MGVREGAEPTGKTASNQEGQHQDVSLCWAGPGPSH